MLETILYIIAFYLVFKLGGIHTRIMIRQQLETNRNKPKVAKDGVLVIEKINENYYGYLDDNFIGQGKQPDDITKIVTDIINKNPSLYQTIVVKTKNI
jgi:hypothetical protein